MSDDPPDTVGGNEEASVKRVEPEMKFTDDEGTEAAAWQQLPPEREFFANPYDPPIKALVQEMKCGRHFSGTVSGMTQGKVSS